MFFTYITGNRIEKVLYRLYNVTYIFHTLWPSNLVKQINSINGQHNFQIQ